MLVLFMIAGTAGAATLNVGQGQAYGTIQSALDASETGDVISVSEGTYYENVLLRKSGVIIMGKNKEKTIIDGQKTGSVIRIETNDVTISGLTIRNNGGSGKADGGVSMYNANNNMIANSIFENNTAGISIDSSSNNNVITGNIIRYNYREGIRLFSCLDNKIYNNQIQKNQIGIYADSFRGGQMYSNNFIDNLDHAYDNSGKNAWDDGKSGNFWGSYKGSAPFNIKGGANALDNFPLSGAVTLKDVAINIPTTANRQEQKTQEETSKSTPGFEGVLFIVAIGILGCRSSKN
ncbi:MAG: right-handed parallel beta-helix repeat-containing protein [Euryarchaeota archaeon]|nr:right-handed parallel beta-helix repeat-containing protein [Euryarchaeota archaeon]